MGSSLVLEAHDVRKIYRTGAESVDALRKVSLSVPEGQFVAVTGPSGSGKTTLLNCLSGLDDIDSGTVLIDGIDIHKMSDRERTHHRAQTMGFVFQAFNLIPVFTAVENVELPLLLRGMNSAMARKTAERTLDRMQLSHRINHKPAELSGGEQQRVAVARALAGSPRLVWADEPTGNLDSEHAQQVMELFRDLNSDGLTLILVTHDANVANMATRRVVVRDGDIVSDQN
jgi:putative ABC transport system ATP-binding protein